MACDEIGWFVGIDWASERHQVCLLDARGEAVGERSVRHGGLETFTSGAATLQIDADIIVTL